MANTPVKTGRPLAFESVEELQAKIDEYFQSREPFIAKTRIKIMKADGTHYWKEDETLIPERPKTMEGLARALDVHRSTLTNYKDKPEFFDTLARAKAICAEYSEEQLYSKFSNGAIFALKNNHDWIDKSEILNKNYVLDDLDELDAEVDINQEKEAVANAAAQALEAKNGQGSPAGEQVVAAEPPVQNQE